MATEPADFISDLQPTRPAGDEQVSEADDHIRLIKECITSTFIGTDSDPWDQQLLVGPRALNNLNDELNLSAYVTLDGPEQTISSPKIFEESIQANKGTLNYLGSPVTGHYLGVNIFGNNGEQSFIGGPDHNAVKMGPSFQDQSTVLNTVNWQQHMLNALHPVGSVIFSTLPANPASRFPGTTWNRVAQGRFIVGMGSGTDSSGAVRNVTSTGNTDGEYEHKLTIAEMPAHNHYQKLDLNGPRQWTAYWGEGEPNTSTATMDNTGGGGAHENTPPGYAMYVWERVN